MTVLVKIAGAILAASLLVGAGYVLGHPSGLWSAGDQDGQITGFDADTRCSTLTAEQVNLTEHHTTDQTVWTGTVNGVMMTEHVNHRYDATFHKTGNNTGMLLISAQATEWQNLPGCGEQGRFNTYYTANVSVNTSAVDTLRVYHNGQEADEYRFEEQ